MNNLSSISFEDAVKIADENNIMLKWRKNNFLLSDYQIDVLRRNGFDYMKYSNIRDLLFDIEESLNDCEDIELDSVSQQISEYLYYKDTKK